MLGFAHHDGKLLRLPLGWTLLGGVTLVAAGLWISVADHGLYDWYIDENPLAALLYSSGAVLVLLRLYTGMDWLARVPALDNLFALISSRAMTIYLWSAFAYFLAPFVIERTPLAEWYVPGLQGYALEYATMWALLLVAVLVVGWVEDVGAARRPRLLPWSRVAPVQVFSEQPVAATPVQEGPRPELAAFVAEGSRSPFGNFVVGSDVDEAPTRSRAQTGTAVLAQRRTELADLGVEADSPEAVGAPAGRSEAVRANFVIDDVTPDEVAALGGLRAGPADAELENPDPAPITQHVEETPAREVRVVAGGGKGSPGSDAQ
jgi:hypothetical protein